MIYETLRPTLGKITVFLLLAHIFFMFGFLLTNILIPPIPLLLFLLIVLYAFSAILVNTFSHQQITSRLLHTTTWKITITVFGTYLFIRLADFLFLNQAAAWMNPYSAHFLTTSVAAFIAWIFFVSLAHFHVGRFKEEEE